MVPARATTTNQRRPRLAGKPRPTHSWTSPKLPPGYTPALIRYKRRRFETGGLALPVFGIPTLEAPTLRRSAPLSSHRHSFNNKAIRLGCQQTVCLGTFGFTCPGWHVAQATGVICIQIEAMHDKVAAAFAATCGCQHFAVEESYQSPGARQ